MILPDDCWYAFYFNGIRGFESHSITSFFEAAINTILEDSINSESFRRRLLGDLVRPAQMELLKLSLNLCVNEVTASILQFCLDCKVAPRCRVRWDPRLRVLQLARNQAHRRASVGGSSISSDASDRQEHLQSPEHDQSCDRSSDHSRSLSWQLQEYPVYEPDPILALRYVFARMIITLNFFASLRSESIETRILRYLHEDENSTEEPATIRYEYMREQWSSKALRDIMEITKSGYHRQASTPLDYPTDS
ncbi:hypothetical protein BJ508DRAFT_155474 [Ascobolus immersus RN42]|uniref:Uncharacterized protein n=1 Tax=Ascobolus immersus RN42 TaxID=1160509 RepID=A0A3N4I1J5_ASCIM|nr:hypothetical protein BJ508DRAFT_155474 [Ascobolus immersus RN42]